MSFSTDKQTIEELNLPGKYKTGSIFSLFNHVKTRGGEQLLDKIFSKPLNKVEEITERTDTFQFFKEKNLDFPVDAQQVNLMREYLDSGAGQMFLLTLTGTLTKLTLSKLTHDERYKKDIQGLQAVIVILNRLYTFLETLNPTEKHYTHRVSNIKAILLDNRIQKLRNINIYKPLSVGKIIFYNHLLKNNLHQQMEDILLFIYELDINISVSSVAKAKNFVFAKALPSDENVLLLNNLYHPSVEKAVGNSFQLRQEHNVLFLTGANMAGKSTLMKSIGISLYLAHIGFPIAADSMEFSIRDGLYSSINVADNINLGYSHFYAEVVRVKNAALVAASGKKLLLMFDELFKGTNVKDAYDGTLAVTRGFAAYDQCLFIVSTHIIEVGAALKDLKNVQFSYMPTIMEGHRPRYTYKMQKGITEDRQGMIIIRNEGILELIGD